jgi:hypothetical protein
MDSIPVVSPTRYSTFRRRSWLASGEPIPRTKGNVVRVDRGEEMPAGVRTRIAPTMRETRSQRGFGSPTRL